MATQNSLPTRLSGWGRRSLKVEFEIRKFPTGNHATLPSSVGPIGGRWSTIRPADSPGRVVNLSSSPEVFQRSDHVVSHVNSLSIFHRRRSHSVASTVVTGPLPSKLLARHMKSISAPKIQNTINVFNTHFSTKIQIIFVSYLLFPPEEGAGRPPWNGAGAGRDGGGLLGRLLPPNRLKGFLKNCAEAQAKKSTAKVNNTFMVAKLRLKKI